MPGPHSNYPLKHLKIMENQNYWLVLIIQSETVGDGNTTYLKKSAHYEKAKANTPGISFIGYRL